MVCTRGIPVLVCFFWESGMLDSFQSLEEGALGIFPSPGDKYEMLIMWALHVDHCTRPLRVTGTLDSLGHPRMDPPMSGSVS